ncbi:hypothetical protein H634G_11351 [Metarhizium anisopliae BRIP 53293]|uniref:Uncharacterized protein n=1 Tax=Metarhizium anisopliae BRIP 53293 TaxID=1291518 RepID=A0A0D9NHM0_METAN|nr:hypothetical protein H634G_11351 [Metarhizium anisopliae BRIP 53293]KJK85011.1 hypothetical protein H633G_11159 [Metarhizium anisopliae BRIP 53284]
MSTAEVNGFMRWEFNRWIAAIEYIRSRCIRRDCSWEDHQRSMVMVTILLRSLQASVNCHHVAKRSQMFKESYNNRKCLPLQGLNFEGSMRDSGLAWLPRGLFNWFDLHMHDELVSSTTFVFNGLKGVFANWKAVETVDRAYKKARELEQHLRNAAPNEHEVVVDQMRKMVYQQFALHVIRQVCTDRNLENDTSNIEDGAIFQGHHGLSVDVIRRLIGEEPRYGQTRGGRRELGNTYPQRVRDIFGWDDGIARTSWDHCYYRQLSRRFYRAISIKFGVASADDWKAALGRRALRYFWIIPQYDKNQLFIRPKVFLSGLFRWPLIAGSFDICDETRWLFGGSTYMEGYPDYILSQIEAEPADLDSPDYRLNLSIDFQCDIPFTNVPRIIDEGFKACRQTLKDRDHRVLAHYELARECLEQNLHDPLCELLLIMVLTIASSSVTPEVPLHARQFTAGPRRDPGLFAVALATRMLWELYPSWFPQEEDEGGVLRIREMVTRLDKFSTYIQTRAQKSDRSIFVHARVDNKHYKPMHATAERS